MVQACEQIKKIASQIDSEEELDWPTIETLLFLLQRAISDLREARSSRSNYHQNMHMQQSQS